MRHRALRHLNVNVVTLPEENAESVLAALRNDPDVAFAERDYLATAAFLPNDPYVLQGSEWHLREIQADQAWGITTGSSNVVVAVLDSGINAAHPDLATQVLPGYDFVNGSDDPADDFGHGTAVSGSIVAAGNNGLGVAGVAYGARVLPVKVMDSSGFAAYSTIAQGIKYAVDRGARIINLSIAGSSSSATLQEAIDYAWSNNVVIVAAAGNNANDTPQYPAACDHVVGVSATEPDDSLAWFSSTGGDVALAAPGDAIWTTQRDLNNPYGSWRGTSFASPIVAGVAALIASENPSLSNTQIVSILEQSADDLGPAGHDASFGYGRVNAFRAVTAASLEPGALAPTSVQAPTVSLSSPADSTRFSLGTTVPIAADASAGAAGAQVTNVLFLMNGESLASVAAAPFVWDWTPAQPGTYTLAAVACDDHGLCTTSSPVFVEVSGPDANAPFITITHGPANRSRLTSPQITLAGKSGDDVGIDHVEVQINGDPASLATGTTNWSAECLLTPGKNVVLIRAVDAAGNVSPPVTRTFTYGVMTPLTLETNGFGRVTPDLDGKLLEIGKGYTVRAVPGPGQAFAGWTGAQCQSPVLSFLMQSNLSLTANFVPSPFPPGKGNYAGLMVNTNGVLPDNSGYFRLAMTGSGLFTGRLFVRGGGHGFHGRFDLAGNATATLKRGKLSLLLVTLHVDLTHGTDQVVGSVTDGAWASGFSGDRNVFNAMTNAPAQTGRRAFVLEQANDPGMIAATGASFISRSGGIRVNGRLADGRAFSRGSMLSRDGDCPFYLPLRQGTEIVIGWLSFPAAAAPAADGTVLWVRTGTNAFAATLQAASAP